MYLIITPEDRALLLPETWKDLISVLENRGAGVANGNVPHEYNKFDWEGVEDIGPHINEFMAEISEKYQGGLRVFAEKGPIVEGKDLIYAGITNLSHFQSRMTMRTRTVTQKKKSYLLTWDDWEYDSDNELKSGRYAIKLGTYRGLRKYFGLD